LATRADAFGQILYQDTSPTTHQDYTYDGLGRLVRAGASFTGQANDLAADGASTYTRDPSGDVVGEANGTSKRIAWTDLHDDVVGQFDPTSTTLTGSTSYDPLGRVLASVSMVGTLGYQSEYTDLSSGRVNMAARWYNSATGQFDTRDTVGLNPVPNSVRANRFAYGDANPLTTTDPTGHWGLGSLIKSVTSAVVNTAKAVVSTAVSVVTTAYKATVSWVEDRIDDVKQFAKNVYQAAKNVVTKVVNAVSNVVKKVANAVKAGTQWIAEKAQDAVQAAKQAAVQLAQTAVTAVNNARQAVSAAVHTIQDAAKSVGNWVAEHKDLLIEIAAIGAGIAAGLACTALTAGAGALACMVGAAALVNLAKDAAQGNIHSIGDALWSVGIGAVEGLAGGAGGIVGGKIAGLVATKFGGLAASTLGRIGVGALTGAVNGAVSGAIGGAVSGAARYARDCGDNCSFSGAGMAALTGAKDGAIAGAAMGAAAGGFGGYRNKPTTSCNGGAHSFAPATRVVMADGSTRPIAEINIGDKVKATDPATGKTEAKPVTALHLNRDKALTTLTLVTAGGTTAVLATTQNHPIWDAASKTWVEAAKLQPGRSVTTTVEGGTGTIGAVDNRTGSSLMRDLTVADIHTYYVVAGGGTVLVHNCGGTETAPSGQPHSARCECASGAPPRIVRNTGGVRGDTATRTQDIGLQFDIMDEYPDWTHVAGGTRPQQRVYNPDRTQYKQPDLIFKNEAGEPVYFQTADVRPDGTFDPREIANAEWLAQNGGGQVIMVPKK
jgi:RHS repeat-associated protein